MKMPTYFTLDTREKSIGEFFKRDKVEHEVKQLDLGDFLIVYSKSELPKQKEEISNQAQLLLNETKEEKKEENIDNTIHTFVIERKSFKDLKASLADKRYREQKSRYLQLPKRHVFYILEDNDPDFEELGKKQYLGMYVHTMIRDEIPVFLTRSKEETYEILITIADTLNKFGVDFLTTSCPVESTQIKKKKSKGRDVYKQQLCCIDGISTKKAESIMAVYPNMDSILSSLKSDTFSVKGIGKVLSSKIKEGLIFPDS